ncbi:uncharacterized protein IUM83_16213 [Phytophthora cinnamomi]|uniref:uncharacterized protein n=1 Tax=Phytophthora cinnamomi TaxID=4785 RepID=UPI00355A4307|nr:hypothetical protein IUM83_16213 [Phytophthora cinnamomi]
MALGGDALAKAVFFLSTTETRSQLYRLLQYGSKFTKWTLIQRWQLDRDTANTTSNTIQLKQSAAVAAPSSELRIQDCEDWRKRIVASLGRAELVFGDARRLFRFLQFLDMADLYRNVREPLRSVRVLRRLRILCFFFFYLTENYVVLHTRVLGVSPRDPFMQRMRRGCNGFWVLSILLAFPLDRMMQRGSMLSTLKKLLDLPVAFVGLSGLRVNDGLFGALGLASAQLGVYNRWVDVMAKFRQQHLKRLGATTDIA